MQDFLKTYGDGKTRIASTSTPFMLGTPDSMVSNDPTL